MFKLKHTKLLLQPFWVVLRNRFSYDSCCKSAGHSMIYENSFYQEYVGAFMGTLVNFSLKFFFFIYNNHVNSLEQWSGCNMHFFALKKKGWHWRPTFACKFQINRTTSCIVWVNTLIYPCLIEKKKTQNISFCSLTNVE